MKADRVPITGEDLARFLGRRLPDHMIPSHLQVVDALPLTDNGKVDRRTLKGWRPAPVASGRPAGVEEPVDELESTLAGVWAAHSASRGSAVRRVCSTSAPTPW